ncbi:MAG: NosD domain-containing protein [Candidatus Heimdallarchaeaceae archaeon]
MKRKRVLIIILSLLLILPLRITQSETPDEEPILTHSYMDHEPIVITTDQNFTDYGFPGAGTQEDPYRIENYSITALVSFEYGVYIENTNSYFIVQNCHIENTNSPGIYGIYIKNVLSNSATIFNNTCINTAIGIYSPFVTIANNTIMGHSYNYEGITIVGGSTIVENNTILVSGGRGIYILGAIISIDYYHIANNFIQGADIGIDATFLYSSLIHNNTLFDNVKGINLFFTFDNVITYNLVQNNLGYGIDSSLSESNFIHHNTFVNNNELSGISQAWDDSRENYWYDPITMKGNYWSDWPGIGNYSIAGYGECVDPYPLGIATVPTISEYNSLFVFFLPFILVPLALYLKRKKS